jgi:hypothetical protein
VINCNLNYILIETILCAEVSDKLSRSGAGGLSSHFSHLTLLRAADKLLLLQRLSVNPLYAPDKLLMSGASIIFSVTMPLC